MCIRTCSANSSSTELTPLTTLEHSDGHRQTAPVANPYSRLGLPPGAPLGDVKRAYRRLSMRFPRTTRDQEASRRSWRSRRPTSGSSPIRRSPSPAIVGQAPSRGRPSHDRSGTPRPWRRDPRLRRLPHGATGRAAAGTGKASATARLDGDHRRTRSTPETGARERAVMSTAGRTGPAACVAVRSKRSRLGHLPPRHHEQRQGETDGPSHYPGDARPTGRAPTATRTRWRLTCDNKASLQAVAGEVRAASRYLTGHGFQPTEAAI